jgi:hypothetical protein
MRLLSILLLCVTATALAQKSKEGFLKKAEFEDRPALIFSNDKLALTILTNGGAMSDLVLQDDAEKLSPIWNPARLAREAGQKATFGSSFGHFVCVDGFGPVSPEENAAGMPGHGEAHRQAWELKHSGKEGNTASITFIVKLPLVQETFTRTLRLVDGENVLYVQSELENQLPFDRPVCWAEHATIGSPFLEAGVTVVDMPARRAKTRPYDESSRSVTHRLASGKDFTWPNAPGVKGGKIDVRVAPKSGGTGDHTTSLMDASRKTVFVTALHPGKRYLLGYVFKPEEFPWVQSWEHYPDSMKWARGMEFGTMPFDVPRREAIQTNTLFESPTYRWLPAKTKIESRFLMFYTRTPEGFHKVDDVRMENGRLVIEDRRAKKQIELTASLPL